MSATDDGVSDYTLAEPGSEYDPAIGNGHGCIPGHSAAAIRQDFVLLPLIEADVKALQSQGGHGPEPDRVLGFCAQADVKHRDETAPGPDGQRLRAQLYAST